MSEDTLIPIAMIVAAVVTAVQAGRAVSNEEVARRYVMTSPKAWLWRKLFGPERALELVRRVFAPLGLVIALVLSRTSVWLLTR